MRKTERLLMNIMAGNNFWHLLMRHVWHKKTAGRDIPFWRENTRVNNSKRKHRTSRENSVAYLSTFDLSVTAFLVAAVLSDKRVNTSDAQIA